MDIFERRNFLTGSDFGDTKKHGTVKRTQVSNMEIWCECFGKERANIRRTDSNELTAILARLGWKRLDSKVRIPALRSAVHLCSQGVFLMKKTVPNILRNRFRGEAYPLGTFMGTPHRHGGSPISTKGNRRYCSCVPNLSYISKEVGIKSNKHARPAFARVKDFSGFENTGGHYA